MLSTHFDSNGFMIAEIIRHKGDRAPEAWRQGSRRMGELWLTWVKMLSSHRFASTKELREMGSPYARVHFRGAKGSLAQRRARAALPAEDYFINKQTGALFAGWGLQIIEHSEVTQIQITNTQKYFGYLYRGTRFMISRPILDVAIGRFRDQFPEIYQDIQMRIHGYR